MSLPPFIKKIASLTPQEEEILSAMLHREELPKGHFLFRQGEVCRQIFFIEKGLVRIYHETEKGREVTTWFFAENTFLTAHDSLFQHKGAPNNGVLLEDSVVYALSYTDLKTMIDDNHQLSKLAFHAMFELAKQLTEYINGFKFQQAEERYLALLARYPNIFQRVRLGHIASFLGITQETLSRIRSGKKVE